MCPSCSLKTEILTHCHLTVIKPINLYKDLIPYFLSSNGQVMNLTISSPVLRRDGASGPTDCLVHHHFVGADNSALLTPIGEVIISRAHVMEVSCFCHLRWFGIKVGAGVV